MSLKRLVWTVSALVASAVVLCVGSKVVAPSDEEFLRVVSTPERQTEYKATALEVDARAYQLYLDDNWKHFDTKKGVSVSYKKSSEYGGEIYRITMTMDAPIEEVTSVLLKRNERPQLDPDIKEHIIEEFDENTAILHTTYVTTGFVAKLISPRDFCRLELFKKHSDDLYSLSYADSDHPGCRKLKGFVRAILYTSGTSCKRNSDNTSQTDVVFFYQSDAKVFLPHRMLRNVTCRKGFEIADEMIAAVEDRMSQ